MPPYKKTRKIKFSNKYKKANRNKSRTRRSRRNSPIIEERPSATGTIPLHLMIPKTRPIQVNPFAQPIPRENSLIIEERPSATGTIPLHLMMPNQRQVNPFAQPILRANSLDIMWGEPASVVHAKTAAALHAKHTAAAAAAATSAAAAAAAADKLATAEASYNVLLPPQLLPIPQIPIADSSELGENVNVGGRKKYRKYRKSKK